MAEGFGLRFGGGRRGQGSLGLGGGGSVRKKVDLFADGATEVIERFTDVWGIVISLG